MDGMAWIEGRGKTAVFSCVWLTVRLHCVPPPQSPYIQTLLQTCGCWLLGYSVSFGKIVWNASAWIREKIAFLSKKRANFHCEPCDPTKTSWVKMSFLVHQYLYYLGCCYSPLLLSPTLCLEYISNLHNTRKHELSTCFYAVVCLHGSIKLLLIIALHVSQLLKHLLEPDVREQDTESQGEVMKGGKRRGSVGRWPQWSESCS